NVVPIPVCLGKRTRHSPTYLPGFTLFRCLKYRANEDFGQGLGASILSCLAAGVVPGEVIHGCLIQLRGAEDSRDSFVRFTHLLPRFGKFNFNNEVEFYGFNSFQDYIAGPE
ncbi:MAG: hypothetical protein ACU0C9_11685, partial [Paracoccaceae bacterium]